MLLQVDSLNKNFGQKHVLKNVSFTVKSGSALGFLGRNGSGKSTTIKIIMDIFPADSGTVTIDGKPIRQFLNKIGYLPEERGLYPKRIIADQMIYFGELRGIKHSIARDRSLALLKKLGAEEYYKKKPSTLSKGNQQKIQLAIALMNDPEIVMLDEPFSGLDPVNAKVLKDLVIELTNEGRIVLFSSHQMNYIEEFCDDICIINDGKIIVSGSLRHIKRTYPRNKVLLVPENDTIETLEKHINETNILREIVAIISKRSNGLELTLKNESDKNVLFRIMAANNIKIDSFAVVEPTLTEIFVEKTGDTNEPV